MTQKIWEPYRNLLRTGKLVPLCFSECIC